MSRRARVCDSIRYARASGATLNAAPRRHDPRSSQNNEWSEELNSAKALGLDMSEVPARHTGGHMGADADLCLAGAPSGERPDIRPGPSGNRPNASSTSSARSRPESQTWRRHREHVLAALKHGR